MPKSRKFPHGAALVSALGATDRTRTFVSKMLGIACTLAIAITPLLTAIPAQAASPGLPVTEDFADTTLRDEALTNANWSTEEEALILAWRTSRFNVFGDVAGTNITADANNTLAVVIGDMDGDGDLDVVAANNNQTNNLYLNNGSGDPFNGVSGSAIGSETDSTRAIALGDMDGDGDLDVVAGNNGQTNKLYLNNGSSDPFNGVSGTNIGSETDSTFALAVGDVNGDGDLDVVVGNTGQSKKLYLNNGSGDPFNGASGTNIGSDTTTTYALALGDLDGDGNLDVVVGRYNLTNQLYLNNGSSDPFNGVSGTNVSNDAHATSSLALGDLDGDGDLDVVAGNQSQTNRLYLNNGSSDPFSDVSGSNISSDAEYTLAIAVGDVDGDGDLDVMAGNGGPINKLYLNNGSSTPFKSVKGSNISSDANATAMLAVGDMDGDGDLDVVAGNFGQANKLYLNNGGSANPYAGVAGSQIDSAQDLTNALAVGDVNGDGHLDVVVGNSGQTNKLYLNNGSSAPFNGVSGSNISDDAHSTLAIALGDMDGDGHLDVVVGNSGQRNRLYLNNGSSDPFNSVSGSDIGSETDYTYALVLADMDGDGHLDVVTGNDEQTNKLYLNNGSSDPFSGVSSSAIGGEQNYTYALAVADLNGDGHLDVVAGNYGETNKLYLNNGSSTPFSGVNGSNISSETDSTRALAMGDVDGDGDLDVVVGNSGQTNKLYLNNGSSDPFNDASGTNIGSEEDFTNELALGDVDQDGDLDVLAGNNGSSSKVYLNNGSSAPFNEASGMNIGSEEEETIALALGDMDGDGDLDVVTGNVNQVNKLYLNQRDGTTFGNPRASAIGSEEDSTNALAVGDVDGDGDMDVVTGNYEQTNKLYLNNGSSTPFDGVSGSAIGSDDDNTYVLVLGDVDGDGDLDLVAGNNGQTNKLYLNNGSNAPFDEVSGTNIGSETDSTRSLALEDVDGDGDLDVVAGNYGQTNKLYLNDGSSTPFNGVSGTNIGSETDTTAALTVGDVDGDGDVDVVAGNQFQTNKLYLNNGGSDPFNSVSGTNIGSETDTVLALALGDVDGDGDLDVVVGIQGQTNKLYLNNGSSNPFNDVSSTNIGSEADNTFALALGDLDGDGDLDVVVGNNGQTNKLYLNNGTNTPFNGVSGSAIGSETDNTRAITLGDVDENGDLDVVVGNYNVPNKLYRRTIFDTSRGRAASLTLDDDDGDIQEIKLSPTATLPKHTAITYWASNNGGDKWFQVRPNKVFSFPTTGSDVRWRAELRSLSPVLSPFLATLQIGEPVAPIASVSATQTVRVDEVVSLDGSGSTDADDEYPLTYGWTQTGGPEVTFSPTLSVTTFTAPSTPTVITFTLTVTDSGGVMSLPVTTTVTVNDTPIVGLAAENSSPVTLGESVYLTATVSSGTNISYTWNFGDGTPESGPGSHAVDHVYTGVGTYTAIITATNTVSTVSTTTEVTVEPIATNTTLESSRNPSTFAESIVFTATVSDLTVGGVGIYGGTPFEGDVVFYVNGEIYETQPVNDDSIATISAYFWDAGEYTVTAVYSGNLDYAGSTSNLVTQVINKDSSSVELVGSLNTSEVENGVIFTATVSPGIAIHALGDEVQVQAPNPLSGNVEFYAGATLLGSDELDGEGVATYTTHELATGEHAITAVYGGNQNYEGSTSNVYTQTVYKHASATSLVVSPDPVVVGDQYLLTVTVSSPYLADSVDAQTVVNPLEGAVALYEQGIYWDESLIDEDGVAVFEILALTPAGTYTYSALYGGNAQYDVSASKVVTVEIGKADSSITLTSSPNPTTYGHGVTFTATVSSDVTVTGVNLHGEVLNPLNGNVIFKQGDQTLDSVAMDEHGVATITMGGFALSGGNTTFIAEYEGNAYLKGSVSNNLVQVVNKAATAITLESSNNTSTVGASVSFTATVSSEALLGSVQEIGVATPAIELTGTVIFKRDGTQIGSVTLNEAGVAVFSTSSLTPGSHPITAEYAGNENFASSTSNPVQQVVHEPDQEPLAPPVAVNDAVGTLEGQGVSIAVLGNDMAGDSSDLSIESVGQPGHGSAAIEGNQVLYTPSAGFTGLDSFTYTVVDGNDLTSSGRVVVIVSSQSAHGQAPQVAIINNGSGETVNFTGSNADIDLDVPSGIYTGTLTESDVLFLVLTWIITPTAGNSGNLQFANLTFDLSAYLNGDKLEHFVFGEPVTMTIRYAETLLGTLSPETVQLLFLDEATWSSSGIELVGHDTANRTFAVRISHLSEFALFASAPTNLEEIDQPRDVQLFMPQVGR